MLRFILMAVLAVATLGAPAHAETVTKNLFFGGIDRPYIVTTPDTPAATGTKRPLIVALHGGGGNAEQFMNSTHLSDYAGKAGMVVVYPEGFPSTARAAMRTWNVGRCCGEAAAQNIRDMEYLGTVLDAMIADFNIDPKRIYVTGHSNGAMMAYRMACEMSDRITAIAPVGGQDITDKCEPSKPVAIFHLHGLEDPCALYNGGDVCGKCFSNAVRGFLKLAGEAPASDSGDRWQCNPVEQVINQHVGLNGCDPAKVTSKTFANGVICQSWNKCGKAGKPVSLCTYHGGHGWAGGEEPEPCQRRPDGRLCQSLRDSVGPRAENVNASAMVVEYFKKIR